MTMKKPKFSEVTQIAMPERAMNEAYGPRDEARDSGQMILRNWIKVARWFWPDEEVADMLEKEAIRMRENAA